MDTVVPAALTEIRAKLAEIPPQHEGLRDFARLNLKPETRQEVGVSLDQYDRRVRALTAAQTALEQLVADGYPDLLPRKVSDLVLQDLQDNEATIAAALKQFISNAPTTLNLAAGAVETK